MAHPVTQMRTKASKPDAKPRHRYSGSVSNISMTSEDFSPNRDVGSPASGDSTSLLSLKEKRMKRRTRSSLGGTEDFIKELDFLTPPPTKKASECITPKELPKPLPKSPGSGSKTPLERATENRPISVDNQQVTESAGTGAGKVNGEELDSLAEESDQRDGAGQLTCRMDEFKSGGPVIAENGLNDPKEIVGDENNDEPKSTGSVIGENGLNGPKATVGKEEKDERQIGGPAVSQEVKPPATVASAPLPEAGLEGSIQKDQIDALPNGTDHHGTKPDLRLVSETPVSGAGSESNCRISREEQAPIKPDTGTQLATASDPTSPPERNTCVPPSSRVVSKLEQGARERREVEKVSVQKRIQELERKAGGKPVHFRSQSFSILRHLDRSHARHHEAEGATGVKLPLYRAPFDCGSLAEQDFSEPMDTQDQQLSSNDLENDVTALTGSALPPDPVVDEIGSWKASQAETHAVSSVDKQTLNGVEVGPADGPDSSKVLDAENLPHESQVDEVVQPDRDMTSKGLAIASDGKSTICADEEGLEDAKLWEESNTGVAYEERGAADGDKEKHLDVNPGNSQNLDFRAESGLGEDSLIVSDTAVPEKSLVAEALPSKASPNQPTKDGGTKETAEDVFVKAAGRGTLPRVAHPAMESSCHDDETSVLLTKQLAVDPLFVDSQQDRLWEMHSQELSLRDGESSQEVRESSAHDDDVSQLAHMTPKDSDAAAASSSTANGTAPSDKSNKIDRPRTPLRSLLAEEEAEEKGPGSDSAPRNGTHPSNAVSPRGNLFRRIVSGGKSSPTAQTTPSKFSPKTQTSTKPFLSSCMCCSPVK